MGKRVMKFSVVLFCLFYIPLFSDIAGFAFDSDKNLPLFGVEVRFKGKIAAVSDINGYFKAILPDSEEVVLTFSKDGYRKEIFSEETSSGFVTVAMKSANVDVYSSFTRYYRNASSLKYYSGMSSLDILNTLPGNVSGKYSRLGRDNFITYSLNSASVLSSREFGLSDYDKAVYSPSGYINSFSDHLCGRIDFITDDTFEKNKFKAELEIFPPVLQELGSDFRKLSLSYQNSAGEKTSYSVNVNLASSEERNLLFMKKPSNIYSNIDSLEYAFEYTLKDYFVNSLSELDSTLQTISWTEDSIPFFSRESETLLVNDSVIIRNKVVVDTVIANRFTDSYFEKENSNPPHTSVRDYSAALSAKSIPVHNVLLNSSIYLFSENNEKYSSVYKYHENDYLSSSRNGYFLKASALIYLPESRSLSIKASGGFTHDKTAPSHLDSITAIHDDGTSDILVPRINSPFEVLLDPFNLFEYDDFANLEAETLPYYNDYPYMTLYETGINGNYIDKNVFTSALCVDYSMPLFSGNKLSAGAGIKERRFSQTALFYPWSSDLFENSYSTSSVFAYGYLRDCMERNNVLLDMNVKADYVSRKGIESADSVIGNSNTTTFSYRFGIRDMINEYSSIRFSAEKAIQQTDETYLFSYVFKDMRVNSVYGDPYLNSASSVLYDFGISFDLPTGEYFSSSIYYREIENLVNIERIESVPSDYYIYRADGGLYGKGFEVLCGAKKKYLDIEASYTYSTCIETVDSLGNSRSFHPDYESKHKINILHTINIPYSPENKLFINMNHKFRSGMPADEGAGNDFIKPNLYLADLAVVKKFSHANRAFEIYLNISNLFNAKTILGVYSSTLEADKNWTVDFDSDTFPEHRIGDTGYDVRKDADRDGFVSKDENYDFTLGMYYDAAYNPYNYTTPREISFGVKIGI